MAAINRDQFDVRFLSCNKWVRCASCESAEHQLVRGRLISQSGRLREQIFGSLLGSLLGSLSGHFLPHSFPCLPQQAPPITSKMAPMVIALFYLAAQIPSGLLCASPQPDLDTTLSPKDDHNPLCPHFFKAPPSFNPQFNQSQWFKSAARRFGHASALAAVTPLALLRPTTTIPPPPLHLWRGRATPSMLQGEYIFWGYIFSAHL